jgi:hypothetical protein
MNNNQNTLFERDNRQDNRRETTQSSSIKIPSNPTKILSQTKNDIIKKCYLNDDLQGLITKMKARGLTNDIIKEKVGYLTKSCVDDIKLQQNAIPNDKKKHIIIPSYNIDTKIDTNQKQKKSKIDDMDNETIERIIVEAVNDENIMKDVILFKKMKNKQNENNMCKIPFVNNFLC